MTSDYKILENVAEGTEAVVYRVRSIHYGQIFAAKVFKNVNLTPDNSAEFAIIRTIAHPHVIRLYDCFQWEENLALIYEFCDGGSLMDEMKEHPAGFSTGRFLEVAQQVVSALVACHRAGVSHRDVKPENLLWRDAERQCLRLSDFGCARQGRSLRHTRCGSGPFMSPELRGSGAVDPFAADVWALGVTFAEMLRGDALWGTCDVEKRHLLLTGHITDDPDIAHMISSMLAPPDERPTIQQIAALPIMTEVTARSPAFSVPRSRSLGTPPAPLTEALVLVQAKHRQIAGLATFMAHRLNSTARGGRQPTELPTTPGSI